MLLGSLHAGSVSAHLDMRPSLACTIEIIGLVSLETLAKIDHYAAVTALGARAWVADFRRCVVAVSDDDLDLATAMLTAESPLSLPIGIVTGPGMWELWQRHVDRGVRHGLIRGCFSSLSAAEEWADRMAPLAQPVSAPRERREEWLRDKRQTLERAKSDLQARQKA